MKHFNQSIETGVTFTTKVNLLSPDYFNQVIETELSSSFYISSPLEINFSLPNSKGVIFHYLTYYGALSFPLFSQFFLHFPDSFFFASTFFQQHSLASPPRVTISFYCRAFLSNCAINFATKFDSVDMLPKTSSFVELLLSF